MSQLHREIPDHQNDLEYCRTLARGSDGVVALFRRRYSPWMLIAVKSPLSNYALQRHNIQAELDVMKKISGGRCNAILRCIGYIDSLCAGGPHIFYEYCELGDLVNYGNAVNNWLRYVPEKTLWKLFADMTRALNHIHHEQKPPLVHGDIKIDNILVARPVSQPHGLPVPLLPNFKLSDFSRAALSKRKQTPSYVLPTRLSPITQDMRPLHQDAADVTWETKQMWKGTYGYGPPADERCNGPVTPAMDIWSLGATIQAVALNIAPRETHEAFRRNYRAREGKEFVPQDQPWQHYASAVYRPLDACLEEFCKRWDWPYKHQAPPQIYSEEINGWYKKCMRTHVSKRATAAYLAENLLPVAGTNIRRIEEAEDQEFEEQLKEITYLLSLNRDRRYLFR